MHKVAQHLIDLVYLCPSLSTQDRERQGTGCRTGKPVHPSKPPTPCSQGQLKRVGNDNFTYGLSEASNASPALYHYTTLFWSAWAQQRGVHLLYHLDDWLIVCVFLSLLLEQHQALLQLCDDLGNAIDWEKSDLKLKM